MKPMRNLDASTGGVGDGVRTGRDGEENCGEQVGVRCSGGHVRGAGVAEKWLR